MEPPYPKVEVPRGYAILKSVGVFMLGFAAMLGWVAVLVEAHIAGDARAELQCRAGVNANVQELNDRIDLHVGLGLAALAEDDEAGFQREAHKVVELSHEFEESQQSRQNAVTDC